MTDISLALESTADPLPADRLSARSARRRKRLARFLAVVALGLAMVILRLGTAGDSRFRLALDVGSIAPVGTTVLFPLVGALILQRRPSTRVAWLMMVIGIGLGIGFATYGYGTYAMAPDRHLPGAVAAILLSEFFFVPILATGTTLFFLWFPADRLLDARWRWVLVLSAVGLVAYLLGTLFQPGPLDETNFPGIANPLAWPAAWSPLAETLVVLGNVAMLSAAVLGVVCLVLRYRRGDRVQQAQIRWIVLGGAFVAGAFVVASLQLGEVSDRAWELGFAFLTTMPIAIGVAITRYHLYDIDRLINRTLVYGSLTAILAGIFTAGIGLAQRVFIATTGETSDAAIVLTTLVVATTYAPLRKRLESLVDRWFRYEHRRFGAYREEVLKVLGVLDPDRAAYRLVFEAVRELEATGGAVVDEEDRQIATAGEWPVPAVVRMPIPGGPGGLSTLLLGPRTDGRPHDPRTVAQLEETARLVASAVALTAHGGRS